jgi:hypothetical protein
MERGASTDAVSRSRPLLARVLSGGTDGNEQLTALTGVLLIGLLAALGVTIVRIGQMLNTHMFLGMLLLGPVALKMGSTGYRFVRYYAGVAAYRRKGPPAIELRLLAPFVVVLTVAVFGTGVALLLVGPAHRGILGSLHKITFIAWLAVTALHILGHLVELPRALAGAARRDPSWDDHGAGRGSRALLLASAIAGGLIIALVSESQFGVWANYHHHHG